MVFSGYAGPKEVGYLFVDGNSLQCTLEKVGNDWFGTPVELNYIALQGKNLKAFYYDCLPARSPDVSDNEYKQLCKPKSDFFARLRSLSGWHVSSGLAKHRKKGPQTQKEVDILIAVDMLTHTQRRNMHRLQFITGDQDFAPLVEAVVREGMYVELCYPEGHTSPGLIEFADAAVPLDVDFLFAHATEDFKRRHGLPTKEYQLEAQPRGARLLAAGFRDGREFCRLWLEENQLTYNIKRIETTNDQYFTVRHNEAEKAKRYFDLHMRGRTEWRGI